ncbi:MAG: hypothetical protein LLF89_06080, partial [Spirochaetaceae bacterium]|nr:hypothetical protein [Spirochaetaceae bacterium]
MTRNDAIARLELSDADRRAIGEASQQGAAALTGPRKKAYDDELLIEMIARGDVPQWEIAQTVGLNRRLVQRIIKGDARKELQPRIEAAREKYRQKA